MPYDTTVKSATAKKKKKYVNLLVSMRFGQRQTTRQKGVQEGTAFASFLLRRKWLPTASWSGVSAHSAWSQDLEHTQMWTKTQLQVIINRNRKLEKTAPSYANTTAMLSAFVCPAGGMYSSFHNDPVFSFPPSPTPPTGMPNANLLTFWSHSGKTQGLPPYRVSQ